MVSEHTFISDYPSSKPAGAFGNKPDAGDGTYYRMIIVLTDDQAPVFSLDGGW